MTTTRRLDLQNAMLIGGGLGIAAIALFMLSRSHSPETNIPASPTISQTLGGGIYAGQSPDTSRPMFTTPKDAPLTYTFHQANSACNNLDAHGRQDWRVPTKAELNVLFRNRAAIGGFDTTGSYPAGWYWSSSHYDLSDDGAWTQRFSDGYQDYLIRHDASALRCVRG
jgi:hypothetical protein